MEVMQIQTSLHLEHARIKEQLQLLIFGRWLIQDPGSREQADFISMKHSSFHEQSPPRMY